MKRLLCGLLLVSATVFAGENDPRYLPFKSLFTAKDPMPYYVDSRQTTPAGLALSGITLQVNGAWNSWNALKCSSPKVAFKGNSTPTIPNTSDPFDTFSVSAVWITSAADPDYEGIESDRTY